MIRLCNIKVNNVHIKIRTNTLTVKVISMGLSCVLSNVVGARKMVVKGKNGYLVEPKYSRRLAEVGREYIKRIILTKRKSEYAW